MFRRVVDGHAKLKHRIHSFRFPLGRRGRFVMGCVYVGVPAFCGCMWVRYTQRKAQPNLEVCECTCFGSVWMFCCWTRCCACICVHVYVCIYLCVCVCVCVYDHMCVVHTVETTIEIPWSFCSKSTTNHGSLQEHGFSILVGSCNQTWLTFALIDYCCAGFGARIFTGCLH